MREYEEKLYEKGVRYIAGVDEAGRGPLAGPVVAAAVVLPVIFQVDGVTDSKKLTEKKREKLFDLIVKHSLAYGIGIIDNYTVDQINILEATKKAMQVAVFEASRIIESGGSNVEHLLLDAITLEGLGISQTSIIKGDSLSVSIAAASIIAKVTRDRMMIELHGRYPHYGFDRNKGYGTKEHYECISKYGICEIHRKSFLKNILE